MEENITQPKRNSSFFKFNPYSIKSRMAMGFALIATLFLIITGITISTLSGLAKVDKSIVRNYQPSIAYTYALMNGANQSLALLQEKVYSNKASLIDELTKVWKLQVTTPLDSLEMKAAALSLPEVDNQFNEIKKQENRLRAKFFEAAEMQYQPPAANDPFESLPDSIQSLLADFPINNTPGAYYHGELAQYIQQEITPALNELSSASYHYIAFIENNTAAIKNEADEKFSFFILVEALLFLVLLAFIVAVVFVISKNILKNIAQLKAHVDALSKGELPDKISQTKDELNEIILPLQSFISNLKSIKLFAQHVGNKDFDNEIKVFNDKGELGASLAEMRSSLKKVSEEDKIRYWTNEGLAKFGEILRKNTDNLSEISENIITNLVKYLNANQGGIFIYNDEAEEDKHLELKACYAFNRRKFVEKRIYPGQGLVGQCFLEEEYIYLTKVPENYVDITSGLGDANPRSVLIVPLKVNEEVFGIIEMASFHEFDPHQVDFILKISESIANTISAVKVNEKTQKLLQNSQQMTEQLRAQEEEMRQNMEELQATQEEVERKGRELSEFTTSINKSSLIIEFDPEGIVMSVNEKFCSITQYASHDIIGKPESVIVPPDSIESGAYEERWKKLHTEDYVECDVRRLKKDGSTMWMRAAYFPIKDNKQRIKKISCICSDITEEKKILEELQQAQDEMKSKQQEIAHTEAHLKSLINNTPDSIMALDLNYKPIIVNDTYKKRYELEGINLQDAASVLDMLDPEIRKEWKGYYDRALSGENFSIIYDSGEGKNKVHREYFFNPIKNGSGTISGLSIFSKDITHRIIESEKSRQKIEKQQKTIDELKSKLTI